MSSRLTFVSLHAQHVGEGYERGLLAIYVAFICITGRLCAYIDGLFSLSIGVPACRNLGIAPLRKRKNNGGTDDEDERNTRRDTHCELLVVLLQRQTELSEGSYESPVGLYTIRRRDAHSLVTGGKVATEA